MTRQDKVIRVLKGQIANCLFLGKCENLSSKTRISELREAVALEQCIQLLTDDAYLDDMLRIYEGGEAD